MSIYLIRHAQSEANINGRTQSHAAIALSEQGHLQAVQLCSHLPRIDHVMISQYIRTAETAKPLLLKYRLDAETIEEIHEFSYLSEAKCANTNMQERKAWVDAYWAKMDIDYQDAADAESFAQFYARVAAFYQRLLELKTQYDHQNLAVFSHGQFLALLKILILHQPTLNQALMQQFRFQILHQPIENIEWFEF
ncbi:broad specificity phosphatase PhoE [Acinetobacter calcoaceticus]|uniref:Broad specificity phosphatase PhoE n=1 Tax=Acinetobacter calcoaceticus TaxID=471 RepID=A0A4R1XHY5_ACICA|nr:broad specificity phosphatase PhoE [Acinetobacter calcoaceticus]